MIFAPKSLYEEYQRMIYRVLSAEPRMPDYTSATARATPADTGMFNIVKFTMVQEMIEGDEVLASSRRRGNQEESKE